MGSKASKVTRAAGAGRKYPSRLPDMPPQTTRPAGAGSSISPKAQSSLEKNEAIKQDADDPDYQGMLRTMGTVQQQQQIPDPAKTVPLDSTNSNSLHTLSRRQILDDQQSNESSAPGTSNNRTWVDASTILQILSFREKGLSAEQIEKDFRLAPGFLKRLGTKVAKP